MNEQAIPERIGRYIISSVLGAGGMGTVYRATDPNLERDVAIKAIHPDRLNRGANAERFRREALALAKINHAHIAQIYEFVPDETQPYLVMEFIDGKDLRALLQESGPFSYDRFFDCAWQILDGLERAHDCGLIHRDLKPSNIILSKNGSYKIIDFGLVLHEDQDHISVANTSVGTPRYLSPEQAAGDPTTPQSDLYCLGVVLHEVLTATTPFVKTDTTQRLMSTIATTQAPPLSQAMPDAPLSLEHWLARLLALEKMDRFRDAAEAREGLERVIQDLRNRSTDERIVNPLSSAERNIATNIQPGYRPVKFETTSIALPAIQATKTKRRFFYKVLLTIWIFSSLATFVSGYLISQHSLSTQKQRWRDDLAATAAGAALLVNGDRLDEIQSEGDRDNPYVKEVIDQLQAYASADPSIEYIYTMRPQPGSDQTGLVRFIVDASYEVDENENGVIDPDERNAEINEIYDANETLDLLNGFIEPTADQFINEDAWGAHLSGYAPIFNTAGQSIGLVGIDASGDFIQKQRHDFFMRSLYMQGFTLIAFLAAAILLARSLERPVVDLLRVINAVKQGHYNVRYSGKATDEFGMLGAAINDMVEGLQERDALRGALEIHIRRNMTPTKQIRLSEQPGTIICCVFEHQNQSTHENDRWLQDNISEILGVVAAAGGHVDDVLNRGFSAMFPDYDSDADANERAIRTALQLCAMNTTQSMPVRLRIGIARSGSEQVEKAELLANANKTLQSDILATDQVFRHVHMMFMAEEFANIQLTEQSERITIYAIKGAISA
jgi:serine/threonine protein kinase/HAMP domain-containing protein